MTEVEFTLLFFAGWLVIGAVLGFLWARFMPRWNVSDERNHVKGCDRRWDDWCANFICDCPVKRQKSNDARLRDFFVFLFLWPFALPVIALVVFSDGMVWLCENGELLFRDHLKDPMIKILGGTPDA